MENTEVHITPQDIIDKEFRVKFRGFDMGEVDAFLEEVAESFLRLSEENTLLNEKVYALQQELESITDHEASDTAELPAKLAIALEDLKQDTGAISAELTALSQDKKNIDAIRDDLGKLIVSIEEYGATAAAQAELPPDLAKRMEEFSRSSEAITAELAALKEARQTFDSLQTSFEETLLAAMEAVGSIESQGPVAFPADMGKTLENLQQGSATVETELAALKEEIAGFAGVRAEIRQELQEQLSTYFKMLETKFAVMGGKSPSATPAKKEELLAAKIIEEPEGKEEETRLPDYRSEPDESDTEDLEFLSEDDILDVDKLRGIFQSVLDGGPDSSHSREGDEFGADLLFLEEDFVEDGPEPEVIFSLEEHDPGSKEKPREE